MSQITQVLSTPFSVIYTVLQADVQVGNGLEPQTDGRHDSLERCCKSCAHFCAVEEFTRLLRAGEIGGDGELMDLLVNLAVRELQLQR